MPDETTAATPIDAAVAYPNLVGDLRGKTPLELEEMVPVLDAHIQTLHMDDRGGIRDLEPAEDTAFRSLISLRHQVLGRLEEHRKVQDVLNRRPERVNIALKSLGFDSANPAGDIRRMTATEARERALRRLDNRNDTAHMTAPQKDQVERTVRRDTDIAKRLLVTETDNYRDAWMKLVTDPHPILSDDERHAVLAWNEYRAMSEGTTTAGGFGIPVNKAA